jgi:hypothetical protein
MSKVGRGKVHTVSITIQWREEEAELAEGTFSSSNFDKSARSQQLVEGTTNGHAKQSHTRHASATRSSERLLPSDRIVLNALRARLPQGEKVTTLVRTRELQAECEISRRQVQICVKRLSEKGLIKRVIEAMNLGSTDGYRYHLSEDVLRG